MFDRISRVGRRWPLALSIAALAACADEPTAPTIPTVSGPNAAIGDVIIVTTSSGGKDVGSLRWAVAQATGGEVIRFAPDLAGDTIIVDSTVVIQRPITIEGPADKGVTISGNYERHILEIRDSLPSATTLRNLALVNGMGSGSYGGGAVIAASDVVLENATLSGHKGPQTSALYALKNATLINTTVSNNTNAFSLPAVRVDKQLTLINSTIAYNMYGGIEAGSRLVMRNSLFAANGVGPNCKGIAPREWYGKNLSSDWSCGDSAIVKIADPKLDSLRDNGGPARTHALLKTSPALNAGKDCSVAVDERNVARDATCDIGAFEFTDFTTVTITPNASLPVDSNGWVMVNGSLKCSRDETFDLTIEVKQEQKVGRATGVVHAEGKLTVDCTTSAQPWGIALAPTSGVFGNGNAVVTTKTEAPAWVMATNAASPVKLYWGKK